MENFSHSYSKRSYHANGFTATASKSPYDDVFGGRTKLNVPSLAPRLEDYTEVFGGFHSSRAHCIPILDLPVADDGEEELHFDVRTSPFDYSEIFGGFQAGDFAVPYEDLRRQLNADYDSSDEAWSPSPSELLSDESDPSACSKRRLSMFSSDYQCSFNGIRQFGISNCTANGRSNLDVPNETPHATQARTHGIHESQTSRNAEDREAPIHGTIDVASHLMNHSIGVSAEKCNEFGSIPTTDQFLTMTDISLRTKSSPLPPPSRPQPALKGVSERLNSSPKGSKHHAFEQVSGGTTAPSFGVEVDTSSYAEALKDAVARAQAKCRSAKQSMEKRKQDLQSCKRGSDNIAAEDITNSAFDEPAKCKDYRVPGKHVREGCQGESFAEESERVRSGDEFVLDLSEGGKNINFDGKPSERKMGKEYGLSQDSHRKEGTVAWRDEVEFFEIETCPPGDTYENFKCGKHCMDSNVQQHLLGAATEAFEQRETCKTFRRSQGAPEWEEDVKMAKEAYEFGKECGRSAKVSQNLFDLKLNAEVFQQQGIIGEVSKNGHRNVTDLRESEMNTNKFRAKPKPNSTHEGVHDERSITWTDASKLNGKEPKADFEKEDCEGRCKYTVGQITINNTVENELKQERRYHRQEEAPEREKRRVLESKGNKLKESLWQEEIDKEGKQENENDVNNFEMDLDQEKNKKDQELACKREDHDKEIQYTFKWDLGHKHFKVKNEEPEEQTAYPERVESEGGESEVTITKIPKQVHDEERFSLASDSESGNIYEDSDEFEEIECLVEDDGKLEELNLEANSNEQITIDCENGEALDRVYVSNDETVHVLQMQEKVEKIFKKLEAPRAAFSCDKNMVLTTEGQDGKLESEVGADNLLDRERLNSFTEKQENMKFGKNEVVGEAAKKSPCLVAHFTSSEVVDGAGNSSFKPEKTTSEMACHSENIQKVIHEEWNGSNAAALQFTINKEVDSKKFAQHQMVRDRAENGKKTGDALSVVLEDGEIPSRIDQSKNNCKGREEKGPNECRNIEEQKVESLKKERELETEYLRKIEAEREREREREKDLMAMPLDALEKSYAESNGKIERAASEMWQRGTAEVKKLAKGSIEARLRAERAAVERATAEARQRAFEKATAEKTAYDTRERVDRSSSHRFYTSSDNTLMRQCSFSSDSLEHKNHEKSKLRYSYSSANAGIEGESPQRCKARLERYQRTAERAAKALAEKNMRDLLAQREQAERNRLAETLDAEVKRWSSGKEGNLRALLSTLQYILGPDSGWHPIPLTEVITSAAVKKAFRKATLCVHPDKLQQRGASIQQKYISEKVFDLLKEAWNKFTSEEH